FERMNELQLYYADAAEQASGFRTVLAGPAHGEFARFQPNQGNAMSYDDLKTMEAATFLRAISEGRDLQPSVADALATARVLQAMRRSFDSRGWEPVVPIEVAAPAT